MDDSKIILRQLMAVIEDRRKHRPAKSYTTKLLDGGVNAIGAKIHEEAAEVVQAAEKADGQARGEIIHEAADLIYHLLVMLACCEVKLSDVEAELARRFGTSGLEEKASRKR